MKCHLLCYDAVSRDNIEEIIKKTHFWMRFAVQKHNVHIMLHQQIYMQADFPTE